MPKNILIFADGTGQAGGLKPDQILSNVYKLYRASRTGPDSPIDPNQQLAFYDAGLGTDPDSARVPFRFLRALRKLNSAATGTGISANIVECYTALLKHYLPGDRIYLFGFSRGAYTARCVANVLNLCGIPMVNEKGEPLCRFGSELRRIAREAVRSVYEHGAGHDRYQFEAEREEKARRFRERYQSGTTDESNAAPYFIGVFDTVAALGAQGLRRWLWLGLLAVLFLIFPATIIGRYFGLFDAASFSVGVLVVVALQTILTRLRVIQNFPEAGQFQWHFAGWKARSYDRFLDPRVRYARHAIALDERRADFARVAWGQVENKPNSQLASDGPERFMQIWFPGCHSDIGGGYSEEESRLSDVALSWMVEQMAAIQHPVRLDINKLRLFPSATAMAHCEVRRLADRYPQWWPRRFRWGWQESIRREANGAPMHTSVVERFEAPSVSMCGQQSVYRPEALQDDPRFASFYADR